MRVNINQRTIFDEQVAIRKREGREVSGVNFACSKGFESRCLKAKGKTCRCLCRGNNHGGKN